LGNKVIILYVAASDINTKGGDIDHILAISEGLSKLGNKVNLIICSSSDNQNRTAVDNLKYYIVPIKGLSTLKKILKLAQFAHNFITKNKIDILYLRPFPLDFLLFTRHLKKYKIPYVCELNTIISNEYKSKGQYLKGKIFEFFEVLTIKNSDGILPVTEEIAKWAQRIAVIKKPCCLACNGIDVERLKAKKSYQDIRKDLEVSDNMPVLAMAGFSRPWHGFDRAIALFSKIRIPAKLWLVGAETDEVKRKAELIALEFGVSDSVTVFPWLNHSDLVDIVSAADVGIGPLALDRKGMTEAQSLKVRFYIALGLPVLINSIDSKIMESLPFISYVPSTDPDVLAKGVEGLLRIPHDRNKIREFAKDHLSWDAISLETEKFLRKISSQRMVNEK
jgi:glycosyltransferase involved in cell wall biosynthesis